MKLISRLKSSGFSAPADAMMFFEFGCTGRWEISSFQALLAGKTCMAIRILSASGVLNKTGSLIEGRGGSGRPLECVAFSAFCTLT